MPRRNENRIAEAQAARQVPKIALSIEEAAWSLGVDRSTIDRMMSDGELPYTRIRSKPVIDRDDLTTLVKGNKVLRNADPGFGRRRRDPALRDRAPMHGQAANAGMAERRTTANQRKEAL